MRLFPSLRDYFNLIDSEIIAYNRNSPDDLLMTVTDSERALSEVEQGSAQVLLDNHNADEGRAGPARGPGSGRPDRGPGLRSRPGHDKFESRSRSESRSTWHWRLQLAVRGAARRRQPGGRHRDRGPGPAAPDLVPGRPGITREESY